MKAGADPAPRICDAAETAALLDFATLVQEVERAALEKDDGAIACPERLVVPLASDATLLSMPAVAADLAIHKLITVTPGNASRGLPTIQGAMTVIDPGSGRTLLVLDGPTVTGRRTAAVSMCALQRLGVPDGPVLVIGTGAQARHHVAALRALHPDRAIRVRGTSAASARVFCDALKSFDPDHSPFDLAPAGVDVEATVVITCTTSTTPVWHEPARAATLLVAVGSFRPAVAEVASATVCASAIVVDDLHGARHEAGDLIVADIDWRDVRTLADVIRAGARPSGALFFKSVGCAAWDLAAARVAWARVQRA